MDSDCDWDLLQLPSCASTSQVCHTGHVEDHCSAMVAICKDIDENEMIIEHSHGDGDTILVLDEEDASASRLKLALRGTSPSQRTDLQKLLLCEHMRAAKQKKQYEAAVARNEQSLRGLLEVVQATALRDHAALRRSSTKHQLLSIVLANRDGASKHLTSSAWLRIAFQFQHSSDHVLAKVFSVSKPTIRHVRDVVSFMYWKHQDMLLSRIAISADLQQLAFATTSLRFDCTSRVLSLPPMFGLPSMNKRMRFEVLVCLSEMIIGFGSIARGIDCIQQLNLVRPVIPLQSTNAACLDYALFEAEQVNQSWKYCSDIIRAADVAALHLGSDNASSNLKLVAHRFNQLAKDHSQLLLSHKDCSLHNNDLVKHALVNLNLPLVSGLYKMASLCKSGSSFMRVLHCLPGLVRRRLIVLKGVKPPESAAESANLIIDYAALHYQPQCSRQQKEADPEFWVRRSAAKARRRQAAQDLFDILNGDPLCDQMVHYCESDACCQNKEITIQKVVKALIGFVFSSTPSSPELGKWSMLGSALDHIVIGAWTFHIYRDAFDRAFGNQQASDVRKIRGLDLDRAMVEELAFTSEVSKTAKQVVECLSDDILDRDVVAFALALEPVRVMLMALFAFSKGGYSNDPIEQPLSTPGICIFSSPFDSPLYVLLQYGSSLVSQTSVSRAALLWKFCGCSSMDEMFKREPALATRFADMVLVTTGWIYRRHFRDIVTWPWKLTVLGDPCATRESKECIAEEFFNAKLCDMDYYFSRRLRKTGLVSKPGDLLSHGWESFFASWARQVCMTNAQVEFRNARYDRGCPSRCTPVSTFCAKALLAEASLIHTLERAIVMQSHHCASSSNVLSHPKSVIPRKGISPFQAFHKIIIKREQSKGFCGSTITPEFWAQVREEWNNLPDDSFLKVAARNDSAETKVHAKKCKLLSGELTSSHGELPIDALMDEAYTSSALVPQQSSAASIQGLVPLAFACSNTVDFHDVVGKRLDHIDMPRNSTLQDPFQFPMGKVLCNADYLVDRNFESSWRRWGVLSSKCPRKADVSDFPKKVEYKRKCEGVCKVHDDPMLLKLHEFAVNRLESLLKENKSQTAMLQWSCSSCDDVDIQFAYVAGWLQSSGSLPFRANLFLAARSCADNIDDEKYQIVLSRLPLMDAKSRRDDPRCKIFYSEPFASSSEGALDQLSEKDIAARVMHSFAERSPIDESFMLTIRLCPVLRRISGDCFEVSASTDHSKRVEISLKIWRAHLQKSTAAKHADDDDMLGVGCPQKRRRAETKKNATSESADTAQEEVPTEEGYDEFCAMMDQFFDEYGLAHAAEIMKMDEEVFLCKQGLAVVTRRP